MTQQPDEEKPLSSTGPEVGRRHVDCRQEAWPCSKKTGHGVLHLVQRFLHSYPTIIPVFVLALSLARVRSDRRRALLQPHSTCR